MHAREKTPESIVALFKGGRFPAWHRLTNAERRAHETTHVDLMLSVAREHKLERLEGFRLLTPQHSWERFWIIEFPSLDGVESWIKAEIAPPYGNYGHYEYDLARPWRPELVMPGLTWSTPNSIASKGDPHHIPKLSVDRGSIVVLLFARHLPESEDKSSETLGDEAHLQRLRTIARDHGLIRLEAFRLIHTRAEWDRVWIVEFPELAGAEAWLEAESSPERRRVITMETYLSRKWAPHYFASWVPEKAENA